MTALAQKHKEFSRLACACSNFLFFQGQRNRWIPHRVLLQMGGVCSSSTYKSTAPPVVSTLSELLSKQLISVLGGNRMATVAIFPEIDKMLTCTAALDKAYELACAKLPETEHARLAKALALVQSGGVFETDHGYWEVASQSEGGEPHAVNGSCDCDWRHFHPAERCTHMLAVALQKKTWQLMQASQQAGTGELGTGDIA